MHRTMNMNAAVAVFEICRYNVASHVLLLLLSPFGMVQLSLVKSWQRYHLPDLCRPLIFCHPDQSVG